MTDTRYPNETAEYRKARAALLEEESALVAKVKDAAPLRRNLPLGGRLKEDDVCVGANETNVGQDVRFSDLFGDKQTLLLFSYMFGPNWDKPCLSCTSLIDGFDLAVVAVSEHARRRSCRTVR
jgi:predicted dithiol-disulfide oxidoreductase (DUF899 family)